MFRDAMYSPATAVQYPTGVCVPAGRSQNSALARCASVRVADIIVISARSALNAAEPNAGGAPGRNCAADARKYGVTPPNVAPAGGPFAVHIPGPVGTEPVHGVVKRSAFSRSTIDAPAARPMASPRVNCGCTFPGPSFPSASTRSSRALAPAGKKNPSTCADAPATAPRLASRALRPPAPTP